MRDIGVANLIASVIVSLGVLFGKTDRVEVIAICLVMSSIFTLMAIVDLEKRLEK